MKLDTFTFDIDSDGIAHAVFDVPGRSMNTLTGKAVADIIAFTQEVATNDAIKGLVISSGKASGFCAGADLGEMGERFGMKPRARIRAMASIGSEPGIMLTGPTDVSLKALKKAGMNPEDIDLYELNEAFASVVLLMMHKLNIPHDKMNVNGGAIAMGHPLGATGGMLMGTMVDELERSGKETALITLCVGAGMGTATIIERV